jgi:hypothetical protein
LRYRCDKEKSEATGGWAIKYLALLDFFRLSSQHATRAIHGDENPIKSRRR